MRQERLKREQEKPLPQQNKWEPRPLVEQPLKWVAPFSLALFSSTQLHWSDPAQEIIRVLKTVLQHNLIGSKYLSFAPSLRTEEKQRSIWTTSQYSLRLTQPPASYSTLGANSLRRTIHINLWRLRTSQLTQLKWIVLRTCLMAPSDLSYCTFPLNFELILNRKPSLYLQYSSILPVLSIFFRRNILCTIRSNIP